MELREQKRLEEAALKQRLYSEYLRKQMEEQDRKKRGSSGMMSDNERKINMRDIEAFENRESVVHAKLVGFRSSPIGEQQKYIAKQYGYKPQGSGNHSSALGLGGYLAVTPRLDEIAYREPAPDSVLNAPPKRQYLLTYDRFP
jgi:hypothetical protein